MFDSRIAFNLSGCAHKEVNMPVGRELAASYQFTMVRNEEPFSVGQGDSTRTYFSKRFGKAGSQRSRILRRLCVCVLDTGSVLRHFGIIGNIAT